MRILSRRKTTAVSYPPGMTCLNGFVRQMDCCLLCLSLLCLSGCGSSTAAQGEVNRAVPGLTTKASPRADGNAVVQDHVSGARLERAASNDIEGRLREIARDYSAYAQVGDAGVWAPELCFAPAGMFSPSMSEADALSAHGQKLYYLFVQNAGPYLETTGPQPIGQAIVKQSWIPKQAANDAERGEADGRVLSPRDGKYYIPDRQSDLFIMYKAHPTTPGTDRGWVYAVATPNGERITSSGRIASCMKCHVQAEHDRVFGPKRNHDGE